MLQKKSKEKREDESNSVNEIALELLQYSYLEHFKAAKDLSLVLPLKHPKRIKLEEEMNKMLQMINKLKG